MVNIQTNFEYFVYIIFGPLVLFLGLLGNVLGLVVLRRKNLEKLGPKRMYQYLFKIDLICLLIVLNNHLVQSFDMGFQVLSRLSCKLYMYFAYTFSPITPMILVYILIERYLAIKYPVESNLLRNKKCQLIYISVIVVINILYFMYIPFISDLKYESSLNSTTNRTLCKIVRSKKITSYFVFSIRVLVPFTFIFIFSLMLVLKIVNSRNHVSTFYSRKENLLFKRDVYLSILAILSNFLMICFNLPLYIIFFIKEKDSNVGFVFCLHLYHMCYVIYFYFFFITNSMFRREFLSIFIKLKKKKTQSLSVEEDEYREIGV